MFRVVKPGARMALVGIVGEGTAGLGALLEEAESAGMVGGVELRGLAGEGTAVYSQWPSEGACLGFRDRAMREVGGEWTVFGLVRGEQAPGSAELGTGCVVLITVAFDAGDVARARRWVEGMFEVHGPEAEPVPGMIAAHFHMSADGSRVVNVAEWTDAASHVAMMEGGAAEAEEGGDAVAEAAGDDAAPGDGEAGESGPGDGVLGYSIARFEVVRSLS